MFLSSPEAFFVSLCTWWIKAAIQEYILRSWSLVRMGTTANQKKLFFNAHSGEWQDFLVDDISDQETRMAESEESDNRRKALGEALSALNDRERRIFEARRLADEPITLEELADEFGVSRERVRQIGVCAFEKVQKSVNNRVAAMEAPAPLPAH
jgi:RNA polymerase sigma-32 factor